MNKYKLTTTCLLILLPTISIWADENNTTGFKDNLSNKANPTRLQQNGKTITGIVQDAFGPIAGANIIVKGTTNGCITDMDGKFTLDNVPANTTLVISYIGFTTQEIRVGSQTSFNITLQEDSEALDEVVVVGYGVMKKKDLTGAVAQLNSSSMKDLKVSHPTEAMAGKLAGVQVQQVGGQPGQAATIRVRGAGSITASSTPLYVVDGYPLGEQNLNAINPNDIESIEVLKDASAAAIYGSRAANGVVLVTTKSGKAGKVSVSLDAYVGFQNVTKTLDLMNAQEFIEFSRESFNNHYLDKVPGASPSDPLEMRPSGNRYRYPAFYDDAAYVASLGEGTDWQDEIYRTAPMQNYQLTVTGGDDKTKYMFSAGYYNQEGIVINSDYERFSARAKIDSEINSWLKMGINLAPTYMNANKTTQGHWASDGVINSALATSSAVPVYNEDGTWASQSMYAVASDGLTGVPNAVACTHIHNYDTDLRLFSNGYIELALMKNLKFKSTIGADIREYRNEYFRPSTIPSNGKVAPLPSTDRSASETTAETVNWLNENTLTYFGSWDKHEVDAIIGMTEQKNIYRYTYASGKDFPNDMIQTINNATVKSSSSSRKTWTLLSYLARVNYRFNNKYYLTGSIRADGSSRFGKNNRYGYFPSGSVAWRLSQEDFLKDLKWLSDMKIRVSYGITGNNSIGDYSSIGLMSNANYVLGTGTGNVVNGAAQSSFSNDDLTWEKTHQTDLGFEISVLDSRLSLSLDLYHRKTTDLLMNVDIPTITGFSQAMQNIGKMQNKGLEITLSGTPFRGKDFTWDATANLSINRNKVLALGPTGDPIYSDGGAGTTHITMIGKPIGSFYGYKMLGIFKTKEELDAYPHFADTQVGDVKFEDVNGDHKIDANDRTFIGNNMPDFTWGMTHTFTFKNFDASLSLQGVVGNEVLHIGRRFYTQGEGNQNQLKEMLGRWQSEENPGSGWIPRANSQPTGQNNAISSRWVEDGSFLRINNLTIGYTLPEKFIRKCSLQRARVYVSTQNLLTISSYSGYNPETSFKEDNVTAPGTDYGMYPLYRTCTFGINVTF
ncbi:MAG: TonB-dependent receptor [Parabacteroides sp.]|nr:TonB-dependent receptor [Parabacteroides sp.]